MWSCIGAFISLAIPEFLVPVACRRKKTWAQQQVQIKKASQDLMLGLEESKGRERSLTDEIDKMKREVNAIAKSAKKTTSTGKKMSPSKVSELRKQAEYIIQNMLMKESERDAVRTTLNITTTNLGSIRTYITQQETFHNINKTLSAIKHVGLDLEQTEQMIEKSARTADEMREVSSGISDRMAASAPTTNFSDTISTMLDSLFETDTSGMGSDRMSSSLPFPEVEDQSEDENAHELEILSS